MKYNPTRERYWKAFTSIEREVYPIAARSRRLLPTYHRLCNLSIETAKSFEELALMSDDELLRNSNIGVKSIELLREIVRRQGELGEEDIP